MRKQQLEELTAALDQRLDGIKTEVGHVREEVVRKLERLDAWLITRDPSTRAAAEAYEGLRKQVSAGAKARRMHLVDLAKLDLLVRTFETRLAEDPTTSARDLLDSLGDHAREWAADAGLSAIDALSNETISHFEILDESRDGPSNTGHVLKPAYVDEADGTPILIRRGTARLVHDPALAEAAPPRATPTESADGPHSEAPTEEAVEGLEVEDDAPSSSEPEANGAHEQESESTSEGQR